MRGDVSHFDLSSAERAGVGGGRVGEGGGDKLNGQCP